MRTILISVLLLSNHLLYSQSIEMMEEKVTQIIFPDDVKTVKGGFIPTDFLMDIKENVLYIQPYGSFVESNLNVVTTGGLYYSFTIRYNPEAITFNHIVTPEQAIFGQTRLSNDGGAQERKPEVESTDIASRILKSPNTLFSRNAVRYKKTYMYLRGIYIHEDKLYLRVQFQNKSNIPYDFEYIAFYVKEKKQKKNSTKEQVQMNPENIYRESKTIPAKGDIEIIYSFSKFTIGKEKALFIDMIEKEGERNLSLQVDNTMLLDARTL